MDSTGESDGRIVTFYSFKGGVGRTMALANVAFLAAANGKRVLVMDWDLEAPGLAYYFRGMQEGAGARAIKTAPGVMDLVWNWSQGVRSAQTVEEVERHVELYRLGGPFNDAVRPLIADFDEVVNDSRGVTYSAKLDIIGAGSPNLNIEPEFLTYEDALARFDWRSFFEDEAGGTLLTSLRDWAKRNYDYVFIDSRTGFADVAGICTMQLPDEVALCFVYNRQNIDGASAVSCAIRKQRGSDIELHAVPMRTSQENTTEEASARARARKELARRGGFGVDAVEDDLQRLAVRQAPNVPFFETIAQVAANRQRADQLTLDYFNLASEIVGPELEIPELYEEWINGVRRRLQPKLVTADYVLKLKSDEPERAYQEVYQLIEGAFEDLLDGLPDEEYMRALIDLSVQVSSQIGPFESSGLLTVALDLVRALADLEPEGWRSTLAETIELYLERAAFSLDEDEELLLLDEADQILATLPGDEAVIRRISNRRRAARLHFSEDRPDAASQLLAEFKGLAGELKRTKLTPEIQTELDSAELDAYLLKGDIRLAEKSQHKAYSSFKKGLEFADGLQGEARPELLRSRFDLLTRLAYMSGEIVSPEEAANYALRAVETKSSTNLLLLNFSGLCLVVVRSGSRDLVARFLQRSLFDSEIRPSQLASYFGRTDTTAVKFMGSFEATLPYINGNDPQELQCQSLLLSILNQSMLHALGRPQHFRRRAVSARVQDAFQSLKSALIEYDISGALEVCERIELLLAEADRQSQTRRTLT